MIELPSASRRDMLRLGLAGLAAAAGGRAAEDVPAIVDYLAALHGGS